MKYMDKVCVTVSNPKYEQRGIFKGATGTIIVPEIRGNTFLVVFESILDENNDEVMHAVRVGDLQVVKTDDVMDDKLLLTALTNHDPHWWCKVEDGFIKDLLGNKKNKIPYDYES